ncbi:alpha/beta hydrolase fold-domain-containing protein [Coprinopsis sp. MPI-PUGE-AT-0042]|nr:alpha/beta hydrolase fold-domain-containing protein [Coprinopsis sp. MPI-PUGE-AT-0042]
MSPNPIDPSFIEKLDPQYVEFHNSHLANLTPPHTIPWHPDIRNAPAVPGGSAPLPVGQINDFDLQPLKLRAFTPPGEAPVDGWPVFIFFHGGGWTLGSIDSENSFCTNMCIGAHCLVITVDYRLAPEHPYPAAVEDAIAALEFVVSPAASKLKPDLNKIAVGGSSSGGNLAAILAIKARQLQNPIPVVFQLLIVPVTDNTASVEDRWKANEKTAWLSPARMLWFKGNYLPKQADWTKWDASPIFAPTELLEGLPPACFLVAERDILYDEGVTEVLVYKNAPHPIMAMDGFLTCTSVLDVGKKLVADAAAALKAALV